MFLVRSRNKDEGDMIWIGNSTSDIFYDDENETIHVYIDRWKPI
jgi:hypothetical protein